MNNIKIYLASSGQVATLQKDFPLYQHQYNNKLLNVFVPTSIMAPNFSSTENSYVAGTALKIGMTYTARNGSIKTSQNYYMRFLKTLTYQNVEYAMFERKLPKEFTLYAGQGANAPSLVANVVNVQTEQDFINAGDIYVGQIDTDTLPTNNELNTFVQTELSREPQANDTIAVYLQEIGQPTKIYKYEFISNEWTYSEVVATILNITATQTCALDVMPSNSLDNDGVVDATNIETLEASVNAINGVLPTKQDKVDNQLTTMSKAVVGAINELKTQVDTNSADIIANTEDISTNSQEIANIKVVIGTGQDFVGSFSGATLPTDQELSAFVLSEKGRDAKGGDTIIFTLIVAGDTDKTYKYIYNGTIWGSYEIPPIEEASNGTHGIIEGTYNVGSANNTLVDIVGGQILNIYVKDEIGTYRNIREYANSLNTSVEGIINGAQAVGLAVRSLQDGLGNNIVNTYLTQTAGATKQYVRGYALPREFNDVEYIETNGYTETIPTTPESGIQFSTTTNAVGDFTLFEIEKTIEVDMELSGKNSYTNNIFVSTNVDCSVYFRLTTQYKKVGEGWVNLNVELSNMESLIGGQIVKIPFSSSMTNLGNSTITLTDGDKIKQKLEIVTEVSSPIVADVYSNETYPSNFFLNTQSITQIIETGLLGEQPVIIANGTLADNTITFEIPSETTLNGNTECEFIFTYNGVIADTQVLALSYEGQNVRLATPYNFESGNALAEYFNQVNKTYNAVDGTKYTFKGFVKIDALDNYSVIVDMDDLSNLDTGAIVKQIDMTAILEGTSVKAYLDETLSGFNFKNGEFYKWHIVFPISLLIIDLPNNYTLELYDKPISQSETANLIVLNNIFNISNTDSATVGDMCSLQVYNPLIGIEWIFNARYSQFIEDGTTYRTAYTSDVVRESNPSMKGADLYAGVVNNTLKTGTSVFCIEDFTNGTTSYSAGITYKITGEVVGGDLIIDATELHDMTREDVSHKKSVIDGGQPSSTDYPSELGLVNYTNDNFVSTNAQTLTNEQKAQARENIGAGASSIAYFDGTPTQDGIASAGVSLLLSRGDHSHGLPSASTAQAGIIEIATDQEAETGTSQTLAVNPKQLKTAIDGIGTVFHLKGSKATVSELPTTGNEIGDVWYVISESVGYVWLNDGTTDRWEQLGLPVDLSGYVQYIDIINNLTSTATDKPLSAYQGKVLKDLVDALNSGKENAFTKNTAFNKNFGTTNPNMDGTASAGSSTNVSRADHTHPTDTSRASVNDIPVVDQSLSISSTNAIANKPVAEGLNGKVDKVAGKGLSTNDFTSALLTKLNGIEAGAEVNQTTAELVNSLLTGAVGYGDKVVSKQIGDNGYMKFQSGLLIQWGRNVNTASGWSFSPITFPTPFTSATSFAVVCTNEAGTSTNTVNGFIASGTTTATTFSPKAYNGLYCHWIAIGY